MEALLEALRRLPGIGRRSAERIAFHLLKAPKAEVLDLMEGIRQAAALSPCPECFNLSDGGPCAVCRDGARDRTTLCVVETPVDLLAIEKSGAYRGLYHVLGGRIVPLEGLGPESLTLGPLMDRLKSGGIAELILATNPDPDGDGTALYVAKAAERTGVRITRLARGLSSGAVIEHANLGVLSDALKGRRPLGAALVETALALPLFLGLALGVAQLALLAQARAVVHAAATTAARAAIADPAGKRLSPERAAELACLAVTGPSLPGGARLPAPPAGLPARRLAWLPASRIKTQAEVKFLKEEAVARVDHDLELLLPGVGRLFVFAEEGWGLLRGDLTRGLDNASATNRALSLLYGRPHLRVTATARLPAPWLRTRRPPR